MYMIFLKCSSTEVDSVPEEYWLWKLLQNPALEALRLDKEEI